MPQTNPAFGRGTTTSPYAPFKPPRVGPSSTSTSRGRRAYIQPQGAGQGAGQQQGSFSIPTQLPTMRLSPRFQPGDDIFAGLDLGPPPLSKSNDQHGSSSHPQLDNTADRSSPFDPHSAAPAALLRSPSPVVLSPYFTGSTVTGARVAKKRARPGRSAASPPVESPLGTQHGEPVSSASTLATEPLLSRASDDGASAVSQRAHHLSSATRATFEPGPVGVKGPRRERPARHHGMSSGSPSPPPSPASSHVQRPPFASVPSASIHPTFASPSHARAGRRPPSALRARNEPHDEDDDGEHTHSSQARRAPAPAGAVFSWYDPIPSGTSPSAPASASGDPRRAYELERAAATTSAARAAVTATVHRSAAVSASTRRPDVVPAAGRESTSGALDEPTLGATGHCESHGVGFGAEREHQHESPGASDGSSAPTAPSEHPAAGPDGGKRRNVDGDDGATDFEATPIAPIHEQIPPFSGADLLSFLIENSDDKTAAFWRALPGSVARAPSSDEEREAGLAAEGLRLAVVHELLARHGVVVPDREFVHPNGTRGARISSFWHYAVPSDHLNARVFNPDGSPTFRLVGRVVPAPLGDAFWPNMFDFVAEPKDIETYKADRRPSYERPFLATPLVSPQLAADLYAAVALHNEERYLATALPPLGAVNLGILNGGEVLAECERALLGLPEAASAQGRRVRIVREELRMSFPGLEHRDGFLVEDCERLQKIIYVQDVDQDKVVAAFVALDHASYYLRAGTNAWASASCTDSWFSLLGDLVRVDNASTVARRPASTPSTPPAAALAGTTAVPMAPTPASSPLHAFLPTSTASYAVRIQVLAHPDLRTEAEKAKQYRKMVNTRARKDKERRERGEDTSAEKASKKRRIDNDDRRNKGEKTSDELAEESRKATDARLVKQGKLTSRQQGAETRNRRRAESKENVDGVPLAFAIRYLSRSSSKERFGSVPYLGHSRKSAALVEKVDKAFGPRSTWRAELAAAYAVEKEESE